MGRKLASAAVNALCAAAILFSLLAGWTVLTTPKGQAPKLFGYSMLTVLTGSMAPALPKRCLIIIRTTPPEEIQAGDIITFSATLAGYDGLLNTHRVVEVTEQDGRTAFRTKGDANTAPDAGTVTADRLVGKVVFHSMALGYVVSFLRTPAVFLALVLIPLAILIIRSVLNLVRLARQEVSEARRELEEELRHDDDRESR